MAEVVVPEGADAALSGVASAPLGEHPLTANKQTKTAGSKAEREGFTMDVVSHTQQTGTAAASHPQNSA